jgi:hypothetical protein
MVKCPKCKTEATKERWYMKFERLLNRVKKLGEGLAKSSLNVEDKAEIWEFFWSFYGGIGEDLEKKYLELKTGPSFERIQPEKAFAESKKRRRV